jgi:hypothetical protein
MKTPTEGLKCLGRKDTMHLISYVVLFCSVLSLGNCCGGCCQNLLSCNITSNYLVDLNSN